MAHVTQTEERLQTICLVIISIFVVAVSLSLLRPVLIPFILAVFFTFLLAPMIDLQVKYCRFPHTLAIITTLIFGLILFLVLGAIISASVQQMAMNADSYQAKIERLLVQTTETLHLEKFGIDARSILDPIMIDVGNNIGGVLGNILNAIVGILSKGLLVLIFVCFLLIGRTQTKAPSKGLWLEGETRIKRYIVTKVSVSAVTGLSVGLILWILKIDLAMVFGLFAFILNFIPSIGSIIATLLPLPVVILTPEISPLAAILAIVLPGAIQFSIGNIVEPKILGDSLDLHPVVILMALIFWGMIWGVVGMLLAAPLTAIMKIVFENIEITRPISYILSGRLDKLNV